MWVRSQDKQTLGDYIIFNIYENKIYGFSSGGIDSLFTLGEYSSEEKAKKVLDELQKRIIFINEFKDTLLCISRQNRVELNQRNIIFQMPQDSEVKI